MIVDLSVVITLFVGCFSQLVIADEKVCSSFCSSLGMLASNPGKSCLDIYQINKATRGVSGDYWINTTTGVHQVYCDMELECGGHKGGWMRITDLDISQGDECPDHWRRIVTPDDNPLYPDIPVCRVDNSTGGCFSTFHSVNGTKYSKICGKVRGYQRGAPDGLSGHVGVYNIDGPYVDGVSITLGQPRKHVWTYAVGYSDDGDFPAYNCPCAATPGPNAYSFVETNYYCESGSEGNTSTSIYYTNDPLWDGDGCVGATNFCCTNVGLPWFFRKFPIPQEEDIEVRICHDEPYGNESVFVDQLQLFIQ